MTPELLQKRLNELGVSVDAKQARDLSDDLWQYYREHDAWQSVLTMIESTRALQAAIK